MRPKKEASDYKGILLQVRVNPDEAAQFRAQAQARKMAVSGYLRLLLLEDADRLSEEKKLRQGPDGGWEIFIMGEWRPA